MKRVVTVVGMVGLLGGCASTPTQSPWLINRAEPIPMACAPLSQEQELTLNLAQKTADEGRLHAALANLERLPNSLPQARLQKARLLRSLNRPEAHDLYASLLPTCLKAQGEHGLGQLASAAGRNEDALQHLRLAASLDPTSDTIRNDLGVVYMNLGRLDEARFELLTSMELNEAEKQPAINLLTLLIHQGNQQQATALADRLQLTPNQYRAAEQRAQALSRGAAPAAAKPVAKAAPVVVAPVTAKPTAAAPVEPIGVLAKPAAPSAPLVKPVAPIKPAVAAAPLVTPMAPAAKPVEPAKPPVAAVQPVKPASVAVPAIKPTPAVKPAAPQAPVAATSAPASRAVPSPQLSNFRPTPVVPAAVAAASTSKPSDSSAAVTSAAVSKPVTTVASAPVAKPAPTVASAPAVKPAPVVASAPVAKPAPAVVASAPAVKPAPVVASAPVAKPAPVVASAPVAKPAPVVASAPVVKPAPTVASAPAPKPALVASATRPELRPGRLIVAEDGSVRVEPTDGQGTTN